MTTSEPSWWDVPPDGRPEPDAAADAALVEVLARTECRGEPWESVKRRLAALGVAVLHAIVLDGRLEQASTRLGRPIRLSPAEQFAVRSDRDLREELVHEAVAKSLDLFRRRAVLGGRWTVDGGAGLDTYFVNGCVLALANPVRRWSDANKREQQSEPWPPSELEAAADQRAGHAPDVIDELLDREDLEAVLDWVGPMLGKAALLKIQTGWSWAEVAQAIGFSPKALERRLHRFRERHSSSEHTTRSGPGGSRAE